MHALRRRTLDSHRHQFLYDTRYVLTLSISEPPPPPQPQAVLTSMGLISTLEKKMVIATSGDDDDKPLVLPSRSPPRKGFGGTTTNTDPASGSVAATESNNTACTSPLTITSLEQASSAAVASSSVSSSTDKASNNNTSWVPQVVSSTRAVVVSRAGASSEAQQRASDLMLAEDHGRKLYHRTPPTEHDSRKLFVGGLPTDVTNVEFLQFFQQFGQVVDSVVMVDRLTKRSRGFGFVTFATEAEANALLTNTPGKSGNVLINGKQCEVKASTPKTNEEYDRTHHSRYSNSGSSSVVPGMWRSNTHSHPHNNRGQVKPRHFVNSNYYYNNNITPLENTKQQDMLYQHRENHDYNEDKKLFDIENEFSGDANRRSFTPLYPAANYHVMNTYGQNPYQPTYTNALFPTATTPSSGYVYLNDGSDTSPVPTLSYPPVSSQGYATTGYFDQYAAAQQQYSNHYGISFPYSNQSSAISSSGLVAGSPQLGYEIYNGYYVEGQEGYSTSSFDLEGVVGDGDDAGNENSGGQVEASTAG